MTPGVRLGAAQARAHQNCPDVAAVDWGDIELEEVSETRESVSTPEVRSATSDHHDQWTGRCRRRAALDPTDPPKPPKIDPATQEDRVDEDGRDERR